MFGVTVQGRLDKAEIEQLACHLYSRLSLEVRPATLTDVVFHKQELDGSGFIERSGLDMLYDELLS